VPLGLTGRQTKAVKQETTHDDKAQADSVENVSFFIHTLCAVRPFVVLGHFDFGF